MKLSTRATAVSPSLTLQITSLAKRMKAEGRPVVNLAAGEPDFDTPEYIKQAAISAIKAGFTKYTPTAGLWELRGAISQKLARDNRLKFSPSQIVVSCGAKQSLYNILQVVCQKGDEVVFASPYWVSYPQMVSLCGARARIVKTCAENGFKLDRKLLTSALSKRTKLLILNSPGNPTGCLYSRQELAELAELALRCNFYVVSDEIYEKLIFDGEKHISLASLNQKICKRTIVVNGLSKTFAMTGWRIGYLACLEQNIIDAIVNLQSHSTSCPCSISQKAALAALKQSQERQIGKMVKIFQSRRDCMLQGLSRISAVSFIKPKGAFYVFCNISRTGLDSVAFSRRLLQEAAVAAVPGAAFGRDDYIRLSFATSIEQIKEGMGRLRNWVKTVC